MTPLKIFDRITICLSKKPFEFWSNSEQAKLINDLKSAIFKLKISLESKDLQDTHAYKIILSLEKDVVENTVDEVSFIQHLHNLTEVYRLAPLGEKLQELISTLESHINITKTKLLWHHLSIENLEKKKKKLSEEQQHKSDLDTIQKVGIFYVLEYTLQVLWEFQTLSDEDKMKLLKEGLKTKAGSLPAYFPLEDTFRKELCYKIYDENLRHQLLVVFYNFEDVLYTLNIDSVRVALKEFNLAVLSAFQAKGMVNFKAAIYAPFGNHLPVVDIISKIS